MTVKKHGSSHGIALKKKFGQHFLREQIYVDHMIDAVDLTETSSVFEIGCGDGFLTVALLRTPLKRLWVFEIDESWATHVKNTYSNSRMTIFTENILDTDFSRFEGDKPWVLLANLPYQITFPILYRLAEHKAFFKEGVIMVQEEVAQKILKTSGRGYGFASLFFQHYFTWRALDKVPSSAFYPPPKVTSRLLYFAAISDPQTIPQEKDFWIFIKRCFQQPRRTLKNNLVSFHYDLSRIKESTLLLRAQQLSMADLLSLWTQLS
jgi:16S rRNA (adenine1518-N6/adenine1519-N6)-dimethyltransferase